ncbi:MAG: NAD(P)/FAD-dependent oxidoreductase [Roseiflexaceae bacterium]|jgi:sarcosine oxidase subunit beta
MRTRHYGAIVIGGGIIGWSTAYHLQQQGVHDIAVMDMSHPSVATSGAGAGFVGEWAAGFGPKNWGKDELAIQQYGMQFYRELGRRHDIHLRENGNMYLARTAHGYTTWVEPMLTHALAPHDTRQLSPHDIHDISNGSMAASEVYGAVYHPRGIQIHTTPAVQALAHEVLRHGATHIYGQQATQLIHTNGHITAVKTSDGQQYDAHTVVVAAGAWVNQLLQSINMDIPLYRVVATRIISPESGIPSTLPTIMIPEQGAWIREHRGGLLWGTGDGYAPVHSLPGTTPVGTRPHYPELVTALTTAVGASFQRLFPQASLAVAEWTQGIPAYSVDRLFCAGAVPGIHGLWVASGDNESGVTHGPGMGRLMADLVTTGTSTWVDARKFALDRFAQRYPDEAAIGAAMPPRR